MELTLEQKNILSIAPDHNHKIVAFAGCGKTSTLVEYTNKWRGKPLYLAFNTAIVNDAKTKFAANVHVKTAHSLAYTALNGWSFKDRLINNMQIEHLENFNDVYKSYKITPDLNVKRSVLRTLHNFMIGEGAQVKEAYCDVIDKSENIEIRKITSAIAQKMLSYKKHSMPISHGVYLKRFELEGGIKQDFDYILIDEAQDLNPVLMSIIKKTGKPALIVGDPWQSIYAFRGAVNIMSHFDCPSNGLTKSFRFGEAIATTANTILSYSSTPPKYSLRGNPNTNTQIMIGQPKGRIQKTMLARTNIRLLEGLMHINMPFHLAGGLHDLQRQIKSAHALYNGRIDLVTDTGIGRFKTWLDLNQFAETTKNNELRKISEFIIRHDKQVKSILDKMISLHQPTETTAEIIVSTAHKAKGREWNNVVLLDDFRSPIEIVNSKYQRSTEDIDQEINLLYVAVTRAKTSLWMSEKLNSDIQ